MNLNQSQKYFLFLFTIAISRLPFLFFGYGSEEDAWALPLVTERIAKTGIYEVSRLPGHPVQELVYVLVWNSGPVIYNLITAILSTIGIIVFSKIVKKLNAENWFWAGIGLAFTPIIYINSTNDMDYTWSMSFVLISLLFLLNKKTIFAAIFIALAVGCRITSGAMIIPYSILIWQLYEYEIRLQAISKFIFTSCIFSIIVFSPVIYTYGLSFFTYYEHFPIPSFAKNFYKGTFAVWGTLGTIASFCMLLLLIKRRRNDIERNIYLRPMLLSVFFTIFLFLIAFIKLPLKAAFMIPVVSALWLGSSIVLTKKEMKLAAICMIISCFFFGFNLADPLRGSKQSNVSFPINIANQNVVFDVLAGTFTADISKRQQRTTYATSVLNKSETIYQPTYIIAGWWLADILVLQKENKNKNVSFGYYTDEENLIKLKNKGYKIYFLPEQENYNDLRFKKTFTLKYAVAF